MLLLRVAAPLATFLLSNLRNDNLIADSYQFRPALFNLTISGSVPHSCFQTAHINNPPNKLYDWTFPLTGLLR